MDDNIRPVTCQDKVKLWTRLTQPNYFLHRFIVLILICLTSFGNYFVYDNPAALTQEIFSDMGPSITQYTFLYSFYSWPNLVLAIAGGFLIDRFLGLRMGLLVFLTIICIGQMVFALGAYINVFSVMVLGRFIFGIGGESAAVAQNAFAARWFKGKELNIAFGLTTSVSRIGSVVNFYVMPLIYESFKDYVLDHKCLGLTLFIGGLTCLFSLLAGITLCFFDKRADNLFKNQSSEQTPEKPRIRDIISFSTNYWLICVITGFFYVAIYSFLSIAPSLFMRKNDMDERRANMVTTSLYIISAFVSPLIGFTVDKVGKNLFWLGSSIILTIIGHGLIGFTFSTPWTSMSLIAFGFTIYSCTMFPLISLVTDDRLLATAYGLLQTIQNFGMALASTATGIITDNAGYISVEIFYIGSLSVALIFCIFLYIFDKRKCWTLNYSTRKRKLNHFKDKMQEEIANRAIMETASSVVLAQQVKINKSSEDQIRNRYLCKIGEGERA